MGGSATERRRGPSPRGAVCMRETIESLFLALLVLSVACVGDDTSGASETATAPTSTDESGTSGSSTSGSTSGSGTTADASGTGESATSSESEATGETNETVGEMTGGQLDELCADYCDLEASCEPESPPLETCLELCVGVFGMPGDAACDAAAIDLLECATEITCEELLSMSGFCPEKEALWAEACELVSCSGSFEEGAVECGFFQACDDGTNKDLVCDAEGCKCLEDDVEVGSCANDICEEGMDVFDLVDKAEECCGF